MIRARSIGKRFRLNQERGALVKLLMPSFSRRRRETLWALHDVSLDVADGEYLGIVGTNGSGKSVLLKILGGLMNPTRGEVERTGRLATLLELGAGFRPDLTGRENVLLNGLILGMEPRQIAEQLDDIVEFSGLEGFIDYPMRTYSSGMFMRLGFAIVAHVDFDMLLVDEVISVGDLAFRERCFERMQEFKRRGRGLALVSHDMPLIERLCDRVVVIDRGTVLDEGAPADMIARYLAMLESRRDEGGLVRPGEPTRDGAG